jgi:Leucine-rich repeat (LRR) protein
MSARERQDDSQENLYEGLRAKRPGKVRAILQDFLGDKEKIALDLCGQFRYIEALPGAYFANKEVTRRLKSLNCGYNRLTELPRELAQCTALEKLYCDHNQLAELPEELEECSKLRLLHCSANHLSALPSWLGRCSELESLRCDTNRLTLLPLELGNCTKLEELWCARNPLEADAPCTPEDLKEAWEQRPPGPKSARKQ